ncbi:Cold shock domain-containing protein E1 [Phytophthora citrophthora]|uniref:Cold shock domain-containing protein E1 n=1 Tax=Phytophthora citrophthora TaxID=4793 RepID=A0AAD9LRH4_9STRA|nr:Cold shock domain-containing protein E1 [Phytophthora citrophthora]
MFRSPQPGDWAAEDEDTAPLPAPTPVSASSDPSPAGAPAPAPRQEVKGYDRSNSGGRFDRDRNNSGGRFDREGGRFERDRDYDRNDRGTGRFDRDREYERGGRFDRDRDYDRSGSGRFDRDRDYDRGGRYDRDRDYDRNGRFDRDRDYDRGGRNEGRADASRWGHNVDRRGQGGGRDLPVDQGFIVSIKENFGFVSCMEREGDLFFHISEAPVDIQLQSEVEFRVKYNQRSDKEMACQLVALPKGTIKVEEVSEEFYDGVVTKSLPRGHSGGRGFFDDRRQREEHGLIEVKKNEENEQENESPEPEEQTQNDEGEETAKKPLVRREFVRFTTESVAVEEEQKKKNPIPHFGDEVRFRVAKHRKTGAKRAVDITITVSAREKLDKEVEAKLASMTRETGVVDRVKNGGGFIKCCDRPVDVFFPFHELREPVEDEKSERNDSEQADTEDKPRRGRQGKGPSVREGDEVSFFVYEDQEDDSGRSRPRLTALRVQKLPPGSVSFEKMLRSEVEGLVSKIPKEPRNGPEVIGSIAVTSVEPSTDEKIEEEKESTAETVTEGDGKSSKKRKGKDGKTKKQKVAFRLCDTEDMSYVPHIDDKVVFDEVLDKRTGKVKAVKVRVVQLNPKNRETGMINAMKEDFGFIKCAERSGDAYFRFSDVMGTSRSFNSGTEVAFDVQIDNKSDHIRATRVQILPRGTVKWEDVAAEALEGNITAVPSSRRGHHSSRGGRGEKMKQLQKFAHGKVRFTTPQKQHLIDFLPELKEKVDAAFIASKDEPEEPQKDESETAEDKEEKTEIRISFPNSLSKFERAALHEYSDWLGLKHESSGEGSQRHLDIVGSEKISITTVEEKLSAAAPGLTVEFQEDDVDDVRYNPRVGDRVKFDLVVVKRTKQFQCKSISLLEAASSKTKAANVNTKSDAAKGEGFIVSVKPEGFGFIQPAQTIPGSLEENLFFHINEITTGQTLAELKEGTEVQYTVFVDEKKKKKRATAISVVPAGTIKTAVVESVKGVVTKASFLQRMKGAKGRFTKGNNKSSSLGRIRLSTASNEEVDDASDAEGESDQEVDDSEEASQENTEAKTDSDGAKKTEKKKDKKTGKQSYLYNIRDISDPSVILREGDEVEFIPQVTPKNLRAAHIRLVTSHAKQGVVTRITEDLGGVIRLDDEEPAIEARFTARAVLRGDVLNEGDRVEFAYRQSSATPSIKTRTAETEEKEEGADKDDEPILGQALSVLRLSSSPNPAPTSQSRGSRSVNSTLKEAMRQVGANAMVKSRMARGPDGTRGFADGWNSKEKVTVETTTTTEE